MNTYIRIINKHIANQKIPKDYGIGILLYPSEIHTVSVIGLHTDINCVELSKLMGVTRGAITQIINRLENKKIIKKYKKENNKKEIYVRLDKLGLKAYDAQKNIRNELYENLYKIVENASQNQIDFIEDVFLQLESFVNIRIKNGGLDDKTN